MGTWSALRESKSARECILLMTCYLATPCPRDQTQCRVQEVSALEMYSIFNTNSEDMARITHLINERSLHRQLPRVRTAWRSQKK